MSVASTSHGVRYPAARCRPEAYPSTLPFVAEREVEILNSRSRPDCRGARWLVTDPDALFSLLVSSSILDGWRVSARTPSGPRFLFGADCTLERNDMMRGITITRIDTLAIVTLTDAPTRVDGRQPDNRSG